MTGQKIPDDIERWEKKGLREDIDTDAEHVHDIYIWHNFAIEHETCDCGGEFKDRGHWNPYAIVDGHPVKLSRDYFETFDEAVGYLKGAVKDKEIVDGDECDGDDDDEEPEIPKHPDSDNVARKGFDMRIHMAMMNGEEGAREAYIDYVENMRKATLDDFMGGGKKGADEESDAKEKPKAEKKSEPAENEKPKAEKKAKKGTRSEKKTKERLVEEDNGENGPPVEEKKSKYTPEEQAEIKKIMARNYERMLREGTKISVGSEDKAKAELEQARKDREIELQKEKAEARAAQAEADAKLPPGKMVPRDDEEKKLVDQTGGKTAEEVRIAQNKAKELSKPVKRVRTNEGGNVGVLPGGDPLLHDNTGHLRTGNPKGVSRDPTSYDIEHGEARENRDAGKGRRNGQASYVRDNGTFLGQGPQTEVVQGYEQARREPWYIRVGNRLVETVPYLRSDDSKSFLDTENLLNTMTEYNRMAHDPQYQGRLAKIYDDKDDLGELRHAKLDDLGRMSPAQLRHMFVQMFQSTNPKTGERRWDGKHLLIPAGYQYAKEVTDPNVIDPEDSNSKYVGILRRGKKGGFNPSLLSFLTNDTDTIQRRGVGINKNALGLADYKWGGVKGPRQARNIKGREDELSHVFGKDRQTPTDLILKMLGDATNDMVYGEDDQDFDEDALEGYILDNFGLPINKDDRWKGIMGAYQNALGMPDEGESNLPPAVRAQLSQYLPKKYPALAEGAPTEMMSRRDALQALDSIYDGINKDYGGYSLDSAYDEYANDQAGLGLTPEGIKAMLSDYMIGEDGAERDLEGAKRAWALDHLEDARLQSIIDAVEPWVVNWLDNLPYNDALALFKDYPELRRNMAMSKDERTNWYRDLFDSQKLRNINSKDDDETGIEQVRKYHRKYWDPVLDGSVQGDRDAYENYSGVNKKRRKSAGQITKRGDRKEAVKQRRGSTVIPEEQRRALVGKTHSGKNVVTAKKDDKTQGEEDYYKKHRTSQSMKERVHYFDPYFDTLMNKGDEEGGEREVEGMPSGKHESDPRIARFRTVSMGEGKDASWPMQVVDKNTGKVLFTLGDKD